MVYIF